MGKYLIRYMSQYQFDGDFYISPNYDDTSSAQTDFLSIGGDTIRIVQQRSIVTSADPGFPGEICLGTDATSGLTYIYYCTAINTWMRAPFTTW